MGQKHINATQRRRLNVPQREVIKFDLSATTSLFVSFCPGFLSYLEVPTADAAYNGIHGSDQCHICLRPAEVVSEFWDEETIAYPVVYKHKAAEASSHHYTPAIPAIGRSGGLRNASI